MVNRRTARFVAAATLVVLAMTAAAAQRGGGFFRGGGNFGGGPPIHKVRYDGKVTFTRVRYNASGGFMRGSNAWNHDYPAADYNLPLIIDAITSLKPTLNDSNVIDLEDRDIFLNPILYMWEPGGWQITDQGAANLREYLLKGGFIVFDDFEQEQWYNFEAQFRRAMPEAQFIKLEPSHKLFHMFFEIDKLNLPHPMMRGITPAFYGVFEDNDPNGRMMALAFHNSDVAEYWEWSGRGYFPVDTTNDAYKVGVNFMMYGMLH